MLPQQEGDDGPYEHGRETTQRLEAVINSNEARTLYGRPLAGLGRDKDSRFKIQDFISLYYRSYSTAKQQSKYYKFRSIIRS